MPTLTVSTGALITPAEAIARFGNAQGNVLKGHGRTHTALLFVEFPDAANPRAWIHDLLNRPAGQGGIVSTAQQLRDRKKHHADPAFDAGLFANLLFTAAGLARLGVAPGSARFPREAPDQTPGQGRDGAFAAGMRDLAGTGLHDPALRHWDAGWREPDGRPAPVHALLLLADDKLKTLNEAVRKAKTALAAAGLALRVEERGTRLLDRPGGHDIEHFGYADGVSQPRYLSDDRGGPAPHARDLALGADELVLVPDALGTRPDAWGSFVVVRKLAQQVGDFNRAEDETLVAQLALQRPASEATKSFSGAMVVGRFENGTPLTLHGVREDNAGHPDFTNDFDYADDPAGLKCPFHAHIRKMNPRGETGSPLEARHRITRRGVPYGTKKAAADGQPAGLLFICYQRNIGQQFEFLQRDWADNPAFPHGGPHPTGLDPVIGQGPRAALTFPTAWNWPATAPAKFEPFVTLRGGEYFYAPSLSGLAAL